MNKQIIKNIINKSGYFCVNEIKYIGTLFINKNDILLQLSIDSNEQQSLNICSINITGNVFGTDITLTNCYEQSSAFKSNGIVSKIIKADLIIIGKSYESIVEVKELEYEIPCLSYFFNDDAIVNVASSEHPYLHKINVEAMTLTGSDEDGQIEIRRHINYQPFNNLGVSSVVPVIKYKFNNVVPIDIGIQKIACARNLFAFFCNKNIPLNQLEIIEYFDALKLSRSYLVYFNYTQNESINSFVRFMIQAKDLPCDFNTIWNIWIKFCANNEYIMDIYYEILCKRSSHINEFNNLAQIIEYYSRNNRNDKAISIAREDYKHNISSFKPQKHVFLTHRLQDSFHIVSDFFTILTSDDINNLSVKIAKGRNFYTHLEKEKNKLTYQDLICAKRLLKATVLLLIYHSLGINIATLNPNNIYTIDTVFPEDITLLLQ